MDEGTFGVRPCGTATPLGKAARPVSRVCAVRAIHGGHEGGTGFPAGSGGSSGGSAAAATGPGALGVAAPDDEAAAGACSGGSCCCGLLRFQ